MSTETECEAPGCQEEAVFSSPHRWCEKHWNEWMDYNNLDSLTKEDVADIAAMLFNFQLLGASTILDFAQRMPWLVERAPRPDEMQALLDLARRGKTVAEADERYYQAVNAARERAR